MGGLPGGGHFSLELAADGDRKELIIWLRSQQGKRAIEVEQRVLQVALPIGSWGEK